MSVPLRSIVNLAVGALVAGTLLVGGLWLRDRTHRWERPRWPCESFVPLRAGAGAEVRGRPIRLVAVNPRCPRCVAALRRLHTFGPPSARQGSLVALIVDTPVRPGRDALRALPPLPVWWDRDGVWRRRWGHRLYGELIEFEATGGFLRTRAADEFLRGARVPAP